jgi:hypothetical protein
MAMGWIILHRPQGDEDNVNTDQICFYNEASKGGTWIQYPGNENFRIYTETPIEVKRMIRSETLKGKE